MNNHIQMPYQQNTTETKRWWRSYYVCKESNSQQIECTPVLSESQDPLLITISVCRYVAEETKQRILKEKYISLYQGFKGYDKNSNK